METIKYKDESLREDSDVPIEKLVDDCLIHIFNLLPVIDRIKVERVCKKWQEIGFQSWSKFKVLNVNPKILGLKPFGTQHQFPTINRCMMENILKRCGCYLEKVIDKWIPFGCISLVAEYCANIRSISTRNKVSYQVLKKISNNCKNITEFCSYPIFCKFSEDEFDKIDEVLAELFSNNQ